MPEPTITNFSPSIIIINPAAADLESSVIPLKKEQPAPRREDITYLNQAGESIKIEDIRTLSQQLTYSRYADRTRYVIVLAAHQLTIPAQNAFLKLLEEPPAHTKIWLVTAYPNQLLPTIRSRCQEIYYLKSGAGEAVASHQPQTDNSLLDLSKFAQISHRELIELTENFSDKDQANAYLLDLLYAAHQQLAASPQSRGWQRVIQHILTAQDQLAANTNHKLTLEHCLFSCKQALSTNQKK